MTMLVQLMLHFYLCYEIQPKEMKSIKALHSQVKHIYQFPWFLESKQPTPNEVNEINRPVSSQLIKLQIEYKLDNGIPFYFFESCSVILHSQLHLHDDDRQDYNGFVRIRKNNVNIYLQSQKGEHGRCEKVTLTLIGKKTEIEEMLEFQFAVHADFLAFIARDCPGMAFDVNIVCPHCMILGEETPYMFYGSRDKSFQCPIDLTATQCKKHKGENGHARGESPENSSVPSAFIYQIPDFKDEKYSKHVEKLNCFLARPDFEESGSEVANDAPRPPANVNRIVKDKELSKIAGKLTDPAWRRFSSEQLNISNEDIDNAALSMLPNMSVYAAAIKVLHLWKNKQRENATVEELWHLLESARKDGYVSANTYQNAFD